MIPVAILLSSTHSNELPHLARTMHVWVIDTPTTRHIVDNISHSDWFEGGLIQLSTFTRDESISSEAELINMIQIIEDHHNIHTEQGQYDTLVVYGASLTKPVKDELSAWGFTVMNKTADGFTANRKLQPLPAPRTRSPERQREP